MTWDLLARLYGPSPAALHAALRKHAVHRRKLGVLERWWCAHCSSSWAIDAEERHVKGCLAAPGAVG